MSTGTNAASSLSANLSPAAKRYAFPLLVIVAMFAIGQLVTGGFATASNINNIITISCLLAVATFGQSFVLIAGGGGIDLSVGSTMSMSALMAATVCEGDPARIPLAVVVVVLIACVIGCINAAGVMYIGIPSLIMTFIMSSVVDGFTLAYTLGQPTGMIPEILLSLGQPAFWGIRWILVATVAIAIIAECFLRFANTGKALFLVGSNRGAAALCGINVRRTVFRAYMLCAVCGAIGGVLQVGYNGSSILKMANVYTMLSVPAAVIGGVNLAGGEGNMFSCFLGAIIFTLLSNLLIAAGLPNGVRILVQGAALLLILFIYTRDAKLRQ